MAVKLLPHFAFVYDELFESPLGPRLRTRPMFGSYAIYAGEKIVFILRKKQDRETARDNGIWVATLPLHNASLQRDLPGLRPIEMFRARGRDVFAGWLNLPETKEDFEEQALHACRLVIRGDARIGKLPKSKARN